MKCKSLLSIPLVTFSALALAFPIFEESSPRLNFQDGDAKAASSRKMLTEEDRLSRGGSAESTSAPPMTESPTEAMTESSTEKSVCDNLDDAIEIRSLSDLEQSLSDNNDLTNGEGWGGAKKYVILDDIIVKRTLPIAHTAYFCGSSDPDSKPTLTFSGDFSWDRDDLSHGHYRINVGVFIAAVVEVRFENLKLQTGDNIKNMDGLMSVGCVGCINSDRKLGWGANFSASNIDLIDKTGEREFLLDTYMADLDVRNSTLEFKHKSDINSAALRISTPREFHFEDITIKNLANANEERGNYAAAISWEQLPSENHLQEVHYNLLNIEINAPREMNLIGVLMENIAQVQGQGEDVVPFTYTTNISGNEFNAGIKYPFYFGRCSVNSEYCSPINLTDAPEGAKENAWSKRNRTDGDFAVRQPTAGSIIGRIESYSDANAD